MKKTLVVLFGILLLSFAPHPATAQQATVGVRGGITFTDMQSDLVNFSSRTGFAGGGFLAVEIPNGFGVALEALYIEKGVDGEVPMLGPGDDGDFLIGLSDLEVKISYLELQLPITYSAAISDSKVSPRIYGGGSVAFELSCSVNLTVEGDTDAGDCGDSVSGGQGTLFTETVSVDWGLLFGAGLDIKAGPGEITIDGRYTFGLSNINASAGGLFAIENRALQFLAGYQIKVGG